MVAAAILAADPVLSPQDAALAAAADIMTVAEDQRRYTRYLTAYNFAPKARTDAWRVISMHVNSLSREPDIVPPAIVGTSDRSLFRLNTQDYGWDLETWEKLGTFDPYFHIGAAVKPALEKRETIEWRGIHYTAVKGEWYRTFDANGQRQVEEYYQPKSGKTVRALAPWLSDAKDEKTAMARAKMIGSLAEQTQSASPILRADWFFRQTAIQDSDKYGGKAPGYYDFLGLGKKNEDFDKLLGVDSDVAVNVFKDFILAAVARSTVAHNNRRLFRKGKIGGGLWGTLDVKESIGAKNFLRNIDDDGATAHDATERFGPLPNGLYAWWLANGDGARQDAAPDFIAANTRARGTDKRVHVNFSCMECHTKGVQPIDDWVRRAASAPLALQTTGNYELLKQRRQRYLSDLQAKIQPDQQGFGRAIALASGGLTAEKFNSLYRDFWYRYETDFDLARISLETGATEARILGCLDEMTRLLGRQDPVLAGLLQGLAKENGSLPIRSEHFEELFPILMPTLRRFVP